MKARYAIGLASGFALVPALAMLARSSSHPVVHQLPKPGWMTPAAHDLLRQQMRKHGDFTERLSRAVIALEHDEARRIVGMLLAEPPVPRPQTPEQDRLKLPPLFFSLQDAQRAQAGDLVAALDQGDSATARALGQLMETCVRCHSIYLHPPQTQ